MAGTFLIGAAHVGALIDQGGRIIGIGYHKPPVGHETPQFEPGTGFPKTGYFCLIDKPNVGSPRQLFNIDLQTNAAHAPSPGSNDNMFRSADGIPFENLFVQSCPRGATFCVTTVENVPYVAVAHVLPAEAEAEADPPARHTRRK